VAGKSVSLSAEDIEGFVNLFLLKDYEWSHLYPRVSSGMVEDALLGAQVRGYCSASESR